MNVMLCSIILTLAAAPMTGRLSPIVPVPATVPELGERQRKKMYQDGMRLKNTNKYEAPAFQRNLI